MSELKYKRVLLKLSGEALAGETKFGVNEITIGNYPRKIDEYLAMGKPVVATRTMTMEMFREHTYLCTGLEEYQDALDKALTENNPEKTKERILFANSHSWENNVKTIYQIIDKK